VAGAPAAPVVPPVGVALPPVPVAVTPPVPVAVTPPVPVPVEPPEAPVLPVLSVAQPWNANTSAKRAVVPQIGAIRFIIVVIAPSLVWCI
jgi:hypothetical protein